MVLLLVEKPSQGEIIAKNILSGAQKAKGGRGWTGTLEGESFLVFPLSGSIIGVDEGVFPEDRRDLESLPVLPPIDGHYKRACIHDDSGSKEKICNSLKYVSKNYSFKTVLLGTDFEYEGAALGVEALIFAGFLLPDGCTPASGAGVYSIDISNLHPPVLKREILNATSGVDAYDWRSYALIGRIRHDFNAGIGIQVSRIFQLFSKTKTTFGTQQTRLLQEIVGRTREHYAFKKVPLYRISIETNIGRMVWNPPEGKRGDKEYVESAYRAIKGSGSIAVSGLKKKRVALKSRAWFDGSEVAALAAKVLKVDVVDLMSKESGLIQKMYEKGYMTYPRGVCEGVMPLSQLEEQKKIAKMLSEYIDAPRLDLNLKKPYLWFKDKERNINHTPYTIASSEDVVEKLSERESVIYGISATQIISAFYPDVKQTQYYIEARFPGRDEVFSVKLLNDDDPGWKEVTGDKIEKASVPADLMEGKRLSVLGIEMEEYHQSPPPLYNRNSLHQMMKKKEIGTESTYRTHIINVLDKERGFVEFVKKTRIRSSPKGDAVVDISPEAAIGALSLFSQQIEKPLLSGDIDFQTARRYRNELIRSTFERVLKSALDERGKSLFAKINNYRYEGEVRYDGDGKVGRSGEKTDLVCPECGGGILKFHNRFQCENYVYKPDGGQDNGSGAANTCPFVLFSKVSGKTKSGKSVSYRIGEEELKNMIERGVAETGVRYGDTKVNKNIEINRVEKALEGGRVEVRFYPRIIY